MKEFLSDKVLPILVFIAMGVLFFVFAEFVSCDWMREGEREYQRGLREAEDMIMEAHENGYEEGCWNTVKDVLSLLEDHDIEDQALIDEIRMLAD